MDPPSDGMPEVSLEQARVTHVRASMPRSIQKMVMAEGGEEGWEALLSEVSAPCREAFSQPLSTFRWIEIKDLNELTLAHIGRRNEQSVSERATSLADDHLRVSHPWLLRLLSPETLVRQSPTLFRFYYRGGVVRLDRLEAQEGAFSVWAHGLYDQWYTLAFPSYVSRALEISGGAGVDVEHIPPPEGGFHHRYVVRWG